MTEAIDVAAVAKVPTQAKGTRCSLDYTRDDKLSSFKLNVHYIAADETDLGTAQVVVSDGSISGPINEVFDEAVEAFDGEPGDEGYPVKVSAQAMWTAAKNRVETLIADAAVTSNEEMAAALVTLLAQAGPAGQKWGKRMLINTYSQQVK